MLAFYYIKYAPRKYAQRQAHATPSLAVLKRSFKLPPLLLLHRLWKIQRRHCLLTSQKWNSDL